MLTPQEVVNVKFQKAVFGGYDMSAVDDFLESLGEDYSNLYKDSAVLKSKIKVLVEKVEEYRATEDAMRMALLAAQRMSDDLVKDATERSERMVSEAEATAGARIEQLRREVEFEENRLIRAQQTVAAYIDDVQSVLSRHMGVLDSLMAAEAPETPPEPAPAPPPTEEEIIEDTASAIEESVARLLQSDIGAAAEAIAPEALGLEPEEAAPYAPVTPEQAPPAAAPAPLPYIDGGETRVWSVAEVNAAAASAANAPRFEELQFGANYNPED